MSNSVFICIHTFFQALTGTEELIDLHGKRKAGLGWIQADLSMPIGRINAILFDACQVASLQGFRSLVGGVFCVILPTY